MNILLVTPWRPSIIGGISTVVTRLSCEFKRKGHSVAVLASNSSNKVRELEYVEGAPVYGLYLRIPCPENHIVRGVITFWLFFPITLYQLYRFLSRHHIDVVVIQYPLPNVFYFAALRKVLRWTLIVVYQGNDAHDLHLWKAMDRYLVKRLLSAADCVVAVSGSLLDKVAHMIPDVRPKRRCIVPNGAPLDLIARVAPVAKDTGLPAEYILTAGHLIHRKGVDLVIAAVQVAGMRGIQINLVVAGDGPERETLSILASRLGVAQQIHFVGNRSHEQVLELMKGCLFFVLASRAEGLPLVIAEAMACGKAVIATGIDGVPDIVQDGKTGLLVPPDDPVSLAQVLIRLYGDYRLRESLAEQGKELALREYNWEAIANRYLQVFQKCRVA